MVARAARPARAGIRAERSGELADARGSDRLDAAARAADADRRFLAAGFQRLAARGVAGRLRAVPDLLGRARQRSSRAEPPEDLSRRFARDGHRIAADRQPRVRARSALSRRVVPPARVLAVSRQIAAHVHAGDSRDEPCDGIVGRRRQLPECAPFPAPLRLQHRVRRSSQHDRQRIDRAFRVGGRCDRRVHAPDGGARRRRDGRKLGADPRRLRVARACAGPPRTLARQARRAALDACRAGRRRCVVRVGPVSSCAGRAGRMSGAPAENPRGRAMPLVHVHNESDPLGETIGGGHPPARQPRRRSLNGAAPRWITCRSFCS
ncbi:putative Ribosomal large subunit pseudouridine synthase D [Burkholderia latens]